MCVGIGGLCKPLVLPFGRGDAKRRKDYCRSEYANCSLTEIKTKRYGNGRPIDINFVK